MHLSVIQVEFQKSLNHDKTIFIGTEDDAIIDEAKQWGHENNWKIEFTNLFKRSDVTASLPLDEARKRKPASRLRVHINGNQFGKSSSSEMPSLGLYYVFKFLFSGKRVKSYCRRKSKLSVFRHWSRNLRSVPLALCNSDVLIN